MPMYLHEWTIEIQAHKLVTINVVGSSLQSTYEYLDQKKIIEISPGDYKLDLSEKPKDLYIVDDGKNCILQYGTFLSLQEKNKYKQCNKTFGELIRDIQPIVIGPLADGFIDGFESP